VTKATKQTSPVAGFVSFASSSFETMNEVFPKLLIRHFGFMVAIALYS
jgi:hypothetical protein